MSSVRSGPVQGLRVAGALGLCALALAACATPKPRLAHRTPQADAPGPRAPTGAGGVYKVGKPYQVGGIWYVPKEQPNYNEVGIASWYGAQFHAKATANGETFDMNAMTAAHKTLPLPSLVEVTNLENGRRVVVRVNDRGPFVGDRIIDMSRAAARELGFEGKGLAKVRVRYVGRAPLGGGRDPGVRMASATPAPAPAPAMPAAPIPYAELARTAQPPAATAAEPAPTPAPPPAVAYRVQAGAFGDRANAERAVSRLAHAGPAVIEPLDSGLYRVVLDVPGDEGRAWAIRDQVAGAGFADARVIHPY